MILFRIEEVKDAIDRSKRIIKLITEAIELFYSATNIYDFEVATAECKEIAYCLTKLENAIDEAIKVLVIQQKTKMSLLSIGNVHATYNNSRKTYQDWKEAVMESQKEFDPKQYEVQPEPYVDWQKVASDLGVERKSWVSEDSKPSVVLKLIRKKE
jgi:hypothetical protein